MKSILILLAVIFLLLPVRVSADDFQRTVGIILEKLPYSDVPEHRVRFFSMLEEASDINPELFNRENGFQASEILRGICSLKSAGNQVFSNARLMESQQRIENLISPVSETSHSSWKIKPEVNSASGCEYILDGKILRGNLDNIRQGRILIVRSNGIPIYLASFSASGKLEKHLKTLYAGPESTAKAVLISSPLFFDCSMELRRQAVENMKNSPEFDELVNLIQKEAENGRSPFASDCSEVYQQAGRLTEQFFQNLSKNEKIFDSGKVTMEKTGPASAEFINDTYIYYRASGDKNGNVFKDGNPISKKWMFVTGKYKYFRWTSVSDVIENLWNWDLSLVSKPVHTDVTLDIKSGDKKVILKKDVPFNTVKAVIVLLDVVAQIDICKQIAENKDMVYRIYKSANTLFNDPDFKKLCSKLDDPDLSAEEKLAAITDFIFSEGGDTLSYAMKEFLKALYKEIGSEALEELIKGGILERILKDLMVGWVTYSVKIANETVPFFNDLVRAENIFTCPL